MEAAVDRGPVARREFLRGGCLVVPALKQRRIDAAIQQRRFGRGPEDHPRARPVAGNRLPRNQGEAVNRALQDHPAIAAALHGVDSQLLQVKIVEVGKQIDAAATHYAKTRVEQEQKLQPMRARLRLGVERGGAGAGGGAEPRLEADRRLDPHRSQP